MQAFEKAFEQEEQATASSARQEGSKRQLPHKSQRAAAPCPRVICFPPRGPCLSPPTHHVCAGTGSAAREPAAPVALPLSKPPQPPRRRPLSVCSRRWRLPPQSLPGSSRRCPLPLKAEQPVSSLDILLRQSIMPPSNPRRRQIVHWALSPGPGLTPCPQSDGVSDSVVQSVLDLAGKSDKTALAGSLLQMVSPPTTARKSSLQAKTDPTARPPSAPVSAPATCSSASRSSSRYA